MRKILDKLALKKAKLNSESGFTLVEIMTAIVIFGVIAAIAIPTFIAAQNQAADRPIQAALQQASILLEQEQLDNNGLYPKYLPNELREILEAEKMGSFTYSYDNTRTRFCLQGRTNNNRILYFSSENGLVNFCIEDNIAEGSTTPWRAPVVTTPTIPTVTASWNNTKNAADAVITSAAVTCTLSAEDQALWNASTSIQYRVRVLNASAGNVSFHTPWTTNRSNIAAVLATYLPDQSIQYSVQARCLITNGVVDHAYTTAYSPVRTLAVPRFTLATPNFTAQSGSWTSNTNFRLSATWGTLYCPTGVQEYQIRSSSTTAYVHNIGADWQRPWATTFTHNTESWNPNGATTLSLAVACHADNGVKIVSPTRTVTIPANLRPPTAPSNLRTETVYGTNTTLPTSLLWNAATCANGSPQYELNQVLPTAVNTNKGTALNHGITPTADVDYRYQVRARCVSGSLTSSWGAYSNVLDFTGQWAAPAAPAAPANINLSFNTSVTTNAGQTATWTALTCTRNATPSYRVERIRIDNAIKDTFTSSWQASTTFNIPSSWIPKYGNTYGFRVQARCVNAAGSAEGTWSGERTDTLGIAQAPKSSNLHFAGSWIGYNPITCPAGTVAKYEVVQIQRGNPYWFVHRYLQEYPGSLSLGGEYRQGQPLRFRVDTRCDGVNMVSATIDVASPVVTSGWDYGKPGPYYIASRTFQHDTACPADSGGVEPRMNAHLQSAGWLTSLNGYWNSANMWTGVAWGDVWRVYGAAKCANAWTTGPDVEGSTGSGGW